MEVSNWRIVQAFFALVFMGVCAHQGAHAYESVKMTNVSPYGGYFRVLYAACEHDDGQLPQPTLGQGLVLDKDKKNNPPPQVIEEAERRAAEAKLDPFSPYPMFVRLTKDPYFFYQPKKSALVFQPAVSQIQGNRGWCLITRIRATLYDSQNHRTIGVADYESSGTGFANFVIQPKRGSTGEFEIVSTDKWWMPLRPLGSA